MFLLYIINLFYLLDAPVFIHGLQYVFLLMHPFLFTVHNVSVKNMISHTIVEISLFLIQIARNLKSYDTSNLK